MPSSLPRLGAALVMLSVLLATAPAAPVALVDAAPSQPHLAFPSNWSTTGPYVDDATAVAASPAFDADHTVFAAAAEVSALGQPTVQGEAILERSTDGGATWSSVGAESGQQGSTQAAYSQIAVSPTFSTDRTVFALAVTSLRPVLDRSTDGGASFQPLTPPAIAFSATDKTLSVSPTFATDHTLALTTQAHSTATSYLSTDAGLTWQVVTPTVTDTCGDTLQGGGFLLVLGNGTLGSYVPNASAVCSNNLDTLYAVSHDNGQHWLRGGDIQAAVGNGNNFDAQHSRLSAAPNGITLLYTDQYGNALRSADGGQSWQSLLGAGLDHDNPPDTVSGFGPAYTFSFASASSVYAVHEWTKLSNPHIFHSSDGGATWSILWQGSGATAQHDVVQAGAHTLFLAAGNEGILRSTDLGTTWHSVGRVRGQHAAVAVSPSFATDHGVFTVTFPGGLPTGGQDAAAYGVYRSTDGGATWGEPSAPNPAVGAGFGTVFTTSSQGGLSLVASPNFATDHTLFEGDRIGAIAISHDGGRTWTSSLPGTPPQEGWFVNALAVSPRFATDRVVYWGGGPGGFGVFKSVDAGQSWVQVTPTDRINEIAAAEVHDLAISAEPAGALDMAIGMSTLFLTRDDPASTARQEWTDAGLQTVWSVAMSPNYQSDCTIFAAKWPGPSGIGATLDDGVYVSHNACLANAQAGSVQWTELTRNLPRAIRDFDTIAISPTFATDHTLFIGSYSSGVFISTDAGQTWSDFNTGLSSLTVHKLALAPNGPQSAVLYAATDDGLWQTPVTLQPTPSPAPVVTLPGPQRLVDTRTSSGPIASGTSRCFPIAGLGGIPSDAVGVVLDVAAVQYNTPGWLTLYPSGPPVPATSTLNFDTGAYAIANGATVPIGRDGQVCVNVGTVNNAPGSTQVILDATGYSSSANHALLPFLPQPQRLVDTRTSSGPIASGASRCFPIAGQGGIPADAVGVVLNVAAVQYSTPGWLSLYPSGQPVPATSTLNFDPHEYAIANGTIVRLGPDGQVCVGVGTVNNTPGSAQVILDATGYLTSLSQAQLALLPQPQRVADTRTGGGPIASGTSRCFAIGGQAGVPSTASGVVVNVTAVQYGAQGWLSLYPAGQPVPATSTLNFDPDEYAIANGTVVGLTAGQLCVNVGTVNSAPGSAQVAIDVVGYLSP